jgi:hypothetical protein
MEQEENKLTQDFEALFDKLNSEGKVKLILKYVDSPDVFYPIIIPIIGSRLATNPNLLTDVGNEYLKIRESIVEQTEECYQKQLDFFKNFINFHQGKFKPSLKS